MSGVRFVAFQEIFLICSLLWLFQLPECVPLASINVVTLSVSILFGSVTVMMTVGTTVMSFSVVSHPLFVSVRVTCGVTNCKPMSLKDMFCFLGHIGGTCGKVVHVLYSASMQVW